MHESRGLGDVYKRQGPHRALDLLAEPAGVADVEFFAPKNTDVAQPAAFE